MSAAGAASAANDKLIKGTLAANAEADDFEQVYRIKGLVQQSSAGQDPDTLLYIPFKTAAASEEVTLSIVKGNSKVPCFAENVSDAGSAGFHFFCISTDGYFNSADATGEYKDSAFTSGTYTWTITTATKTFSGTFTID